MKTAKEILKTLRQQQVKLVLNGDNIEVISYDNKLSKDQILFIKSNKEAIIEYLKSIHNTTVVSEIPNVAIAENYPLSNSQRRLWVVSQMEESSVAYNLPVSITLNGEYDIPCFIRSVEATIDRHEILRTIFKEDSNGEVHQWILDRKELGFSIDYKDFSETSNPSEVSKKYIATDSYKVFDLANGPLIRASIHKLFDDQYVFYYNMHHIISDGWSMNVLAKDVMAYYDAFVSGGEAEVTDLRIQYKDYAAWELEQLKGESFDTHKSYWLDKLSGELPVIDLPGQKSRPKFKGNKGETIQTFVSSQLTNGLNEFVKKQGGSLFTGILTVLNALFYRYTSKEDIIIGSPMVGRDNLDLQDQIGFYVNSLAFRNEVTSDDSFTTLYKNVKKTVLNGFDHKLYPFDRLVEDLGVQYDMSRTPIFDISLTLHDPIDSDGVMIPSPENIDQVTEAIISVSKNDIEFHFRQVGEVLSFGINYNSEVYEASALTSLMGHFKQLLSSMLMAPEKPISTINYLNEAEEEELLNNFNTNNLEYAESSTLLTVFREQAERYPDRIALVYEEKELTYKELDEVSSQLANCLITEYNVQEGDLVGIHLDRSELFILSILGILKSGGAYVPIDPEYPENRKEYIINDSNIKLLLTSTNYMFDMDYYEETLFAIDVEFDASEYNTNLPVDIVTPSSLAYVIYTSGSTGNPKGVLIPHGSIINTILAQIEAFHMNDCMRSLQFASFSFDASVSEIFITLLSGTTLYVVNDDKKSDPNLLEAYIVDNKIDVATLPPSYLKLMNIERLKDMKVLVTAGEAAVFDKVMSFVEQGGTFINAYGPTEVSICGSTYEVTKETQLTSTTIPIGGPIANAQLYILDASHNMQPKGIVGEICIGGKGLAIGYLNREELTAEKFIPNPYKEGERLYKTGDFGKWLPDGNIEFVGREDDQVKIRGHRVELGEIEYQLESKEDIKEAVVLVKESPSDKELIAYIVSEKEQKVSELRAFLLRELPEYMLPNLYVEIDEIPLTVNGKINKKQLLAISGGTVSDQAVFEAPTNETEEEIVAIWKKILNIDSVSIHDEFFLLGGQSLKAITLINEYQKVFNVEIKLKDIFENPTVANQASYIQRAAKIQFAQIPKIEEQNSYPISNAQKRLWVLSQVEKGSIAYNIPFSTVLDGTYNITRFAKAIDTVIERHEILRTVFREEASGVVRQVVLSKDELDFVIDYQDFRSEDNPEVIAKMYIASDANTAFDLANGPLLRASLLQLSDEKYIFYYNTHHIISDGWSMDVLSRDVLICYKAYMEGLAPELPGLRIQYKDYATWQLAQVETEKYQKHKEFWVENLKGNLPVLELPKKGVKSSTNTYEGKSLRTYLSQEATSGLKKLSQDQGGSLFMALLAAWNVLFYKYTATKDVIIGSPVAGRDHADLENQIGFYVNTVALRNQIDPEQNFVTFYNQVKDTTVETFSHQSYPFDQLVEDLEIKREKGTNAIFDVMLALQNVGEKITDVTISGEEENAILDLGNTVSKFDITLNFQEVGEYLLFDVIYNTGIYEQEMIENLMNHFKQLTDQLVQLPNEKLSDVEYLSFIEKQTLIYDFNDTEVSYPKDETLITLFKEQVSKTPNNVAVVFEDKEITYQELDQVSDQLAQCLTVDYNVKNEDFVGIKLDRSEWILISILAILKSGGIYVPIDPNYPQSRIDYIASDCNCNVTINDTFIEEFNANKTQYTDVLPITTSTHAKSLAYVMYTSGSTGKPKGVMVEHRNVIRLVKSSNYFQFTPSNILLSSGAVSFDATTFEYWGTLLNGAQLVMCSQNTLLDIDSLSNEISKRNADVMWFTTGWLNQLIDTDINLFKNLSTVLFGGDRISSAHIKKLRDHCKDLELIHCYGPTENTTFSLTYPIQEVSGDVPIGFPINNSTVYIVDAQGKLAPTGVVGEICLGGDGVARGYLNRPELTEEKFVGDRFRESGYLYKTGDLGRWRPDGAVDFMGRVDDQVKIRGFRIELGEIEEAIAINSTVESVVVSTVKLSNEKSIVAYIVASSSLDKKALQEALKVQLPTYMVPSYYVVMDAFPLNANGKVDKSKLPEVSDDDILREEYIAPQTKEEKVLVTVLEKVLKGQNISIKDNFYSLGGDSINSIQVVSRLKQEGYRLRVEHILQTPVIEDLAKHLRENVSQKDQSLVTGEVGLTPIQHYLFTDSEVKNTNHFNQSVVLKCSVVVDSEKLEDCIQTLVTHHDALRMRYQNSNGVWTQKNENLSEKNYEISFYDLQSEEDEVTKMGALSNVLQSSIDITQGPLFKIGHFRLSDGDRLVLIIHHLVIDGVSWRILLEDLLTLYKGAISNEKVQLPLKTDSFQNWSLTQKQHLESDTLQKEFAYWNTISTAELPTFPVDKDTNQTHLKLDGNVAFVMGQETTMQLRTVAHKAYNTEMNDVLLTGLALAIQETLGVEKTMLCLEGHGREELNETVDLSRTIGWFTTMYPFLLEISKDQKIENTLVEVKESLRQIPNKGIGYGILKYLSSEGLSKVNTTILFNYLGIFGGELSGDDDAEIFEYSGEYIGEEMGSDEPSTIPIQVSGIIVSGKLQVSFKYAKTQYDEQTIKSLCQSYNKNLQQLVANLKEATDSTLTPSDLTYKGLSISQLNEITEEAAIEDVYKLSPLQQGIYYHWVSSNASTVYFEQLSYKLRGQNLNMNFVQSAFKQLVDRYPVLRTRFTNDYGVEPLQIVYKDVKEDFVCHHIDSAESKEFINQQIQEIKNQDRKNGFDPNGHSQVRLIVLDFGDNSYEFIWSFHHILMDGWCISILLNDFDQILRSLHHNTTVTLPKPLQYSNYIKWLDTVDIKTSLNYWKEYLSSYSTPVEIPFLDTSNTAEIAKNHVDKIRTIGGDTHKRFAELCTKQSITQNTFIQAVWGYLLGQYNATNDVVFGSVVSGRPGELSGVEMMVGLFINTIPVRVQFDTTSTPLDILKNLHKTSIASKPHHYLSLSDVQAQSTLGMDLMNHIVVFENYPVQEAIEADLQSNAKSDWNLSIEGQEVFEQTNYDFNLLIVPGNKSMNIVFRYDESKLDTTFMNNLLDHFEKTFNQFVFQTDTPLNTHTNVAYQECIHLNETIYKELLIEDVVAYHNTYVKNREENISPLKLVYKDNTSWTKEDQEVHYLQFWKDIFEKQVDHLILPFQNTKTSTYTQLTDSVVVSLGETFKNGFDKITAYQKGTMETSLLFLVKILIQKYLGDKNIEIGTSFLVNDLQNTSSQKVVHQLPVVTHVQEEDALDEFYTLVKNQYKNVQENAQYPWSLVVNQLKEQVDNLSVKSCGVLVDYTTYENLNTNISQYDISVLFVNKGANIDCVITYNVDLFDEIHIELFAERLQIVSQELIENSDDFNLKTIKDLHFDNNLQEENAFKNELAFSLEENF